MQGSVLGPLLFNINISDLFFIDKSSNIAAMQMIPLLVTVTDAVKN